jgi:hypothetical protein
MHVCHSSTFLIYCNKNKQTSKVHEKIDAFKGIVSRDFVVCFLVSFDRSHISKHQEWVLLLLKVRFRIEFFNFRVWAW